MAEAHGLDDKALHSYMVFGMGSWRFSGTLPGNSQQGSGLRAGRGSFLAGSLDTPVMIWKIREFNSMKVAKPPQWPQSQQTGLGSAWSTGIRVA